MAAKKLYRSIAAIIFSMACLLAADTHAQTQTAVEQHFADHKETNFREKIFVHINKSFYATGELVWFKIYCTDARNNHLAGLSKVAYVELIDDASKTAAVQTMVALKDGLGNGSVFLPFSLNSGRFTVRAYTSWMKNFGEAWFFEQPITVINPLKPNAVTKPAAAAIDIQFMPEGGHLVQNVTSKVAFKLTGSDGRGVAGKGGVINRHGDTVARFSTLKYGIGSFSFKPMAGETYKAVFKVDNQSMSSDLPQASPSGYVLQVDDKGDRWAIGVKHSDSTHVKQAYLIFHNNYAAKAVKQLQLNSGHDELSINKADASDGISYITLFDDAGAPVCERMVFKKPSGKLVISAANDQREYSRRTKVAVSLSANDEAKALTQANLSVSVFRADELQTKDPQHISGYLWLRAALKGNIESPDYYLDNAGKEADDALDNLLLAQGWTQFDWSASRNTGKLRFLPEYTGPIVTAHVVRIQDNQPAPDRLVYLTINGTPQQLYVGGSDSTGKVLFNTQNFYGSHEVVVQTNGQIDSIYRVDIQSPYAAPGIGTAFEGNFSLNAGLKNTISESSLNMQVQNIFAATQMKQFYQPVIDTTWFFAKPTKSYKLDDYTRFTTIDEVLREYVTSISVAKRRGKYEITSFNGVQPLGNPLLLLDGVPVFDADQLFKLDPLKIKHLDVVSANYVYGPTQFNGIMSFTTYKGEGATLTIDPHAIVVDYEGLQQERKFYSPVYDSETLVNNSIPDFRTALYWNPDLRLDAAGKNSFSFYTSDKPGQYIGIIEGITNDGKTGSAYFNFTVKK